MTTTMIILSGLLLLVAMALLLLPMLRHRSESAVTPVLVALLVAFPVAVILIYQSVTTFDWEAEIVAAEPDESAGPANELVRELAARLRAQPDLEGYKLLARSYRTLDRFQDSADAWYEAWVLTEGKDPDVAISYAEALILADRRTLVTSAADLLDNALLVAPREPRALWYGGLSASARGQKRVAAERWTLLLQGELPDEMRMIVQEQLAGLALDEADMPAQQPVTVIAASIDISPDLRAVAAPNDLMFLIARDQDQPMPPIAVKRVRVGDFPVTIRISDTDAMIPGKTLDSVKNLVLVARISKSGEAFEKPGDLFGLAVPQGTDTGSGSASILIDQVVPTQ